MNMRKSNRNKYTPVTGGDIYTQNSIMMHMQVVLAGARRTGNQGLNKD